MKLLWVGDAGPKTGFEYVSNGFLGELQRYEWDVVQLGLNYSGDPHPYPWPVYPAGTLGDHTGVNRIAEVALQEKPDVILLLNDSWGFRPYLNALAKAKIETPVVVYPPVDAPHQPHAATLNGRVALVLCPTQFGVDEMVKGGWKGRTDVVGYGIDTSLYGGISPRDARIAMKMPEPYWDALIVGNVNRNAPRKRLDLTVEAFAASRFKDAYLLLHCDPLDAWGWDVLDLVKTHGVEERTILSAGGYVDAAQMRLIFASLDLHISTTVGEGWGLTTAESLASRVATVVPPYSALGEWARGGVQYYRIAGRQTAHGGINTEWAIPDVQALTTTMDDLLANPRKRERLAARGLHHISQERFSWTAVGQQMDAALRSVVQ